MLFQESLAAEEYNEDKLNTYEEIQFKNTDTDRPVQEILNDKSVVIGFCGTDKEFECTISAISAANYIAIGGYKAAVVEPDFSKGTVLDKLIPGLLGNEMISCGNVDYYPAWNLTRDIYSVDVIIIDFSSMNHEESVYLNKMKKIFLCSDNENMDIYQGSKLQNNNSFKYSILFKENSLKQDNSSEIETMDVFKEGSYELKRVLKIALLGYGIDITKITEDNSIHRINQLNILNQAEGSKEKICNIKAERQVKEFKDDLIKGKFTLDKISLPVQPQTQIEKTVSVLKTDSINSNDPNIKAARQNTFEQKNCKNQYNAETVRIPNVNSKESINKQEEATSSTMASSITYNREHGINGDTSKPSTSSSRTFFTNKTVGNVQSPIFPQKKEEKNSIIPWFSVGKDIDEDDNNTTYQSNTLKNKYDDEEGYEDSSDESYNEAYDDISKEKYEDFNNLDFENDNKGKLRKRQSANQVLCGKETIFITGLKHGCGCSHTGISFAKYILDAYKENICICHKKGAYDLEDEDIMEYTKDTDYDSVFETNRFIIYDCGILGELNSEQLVELKRCNIKIMICNGGEKYLGNLSKFIRKLGNSSDEWIFAFNLVTSKEKEAIIRKIMQGYKICFVPLHDCDSLPKKVTKMWDSVLKRNLLN